MLELIPELKIMGDPYTPFFANGMTMCENPALGNFHNSSDNEYVYRDDRKFVVEIHRENRAGATEVTTEFINNSDKSVTLEMLSSFALKHVKADKIYRMQSFWSAEGKLRIESIDDLHLEPSWNRCGMRIEKFGNVGSMPVRKYFPFLALEDSESGRFIGIQLYCPSSWQIEILCREDDTLTVAGGIADRDYGEWSLELQPGEHFTTPRAMIAEGTSLLDVCDRLVKAQSPDLSPVDNDMAVVFNEYCTTWGNPSFENVKRICDKVKDLRVKYLVIDSGWYGEGDAWWNSLGDWKVNEDKFPGGMKPIADYIRSCGMIPGLWYEFESLSPGSVHYYETEHLLKRDGYPLTVGSRRFWDMEDPWVIDYLSEKVIKLLKEAGFGYLKVDYNDTVGLGCDGFEDGKPLSKGESLRRKIKATQSFFKKIKEEIPGIIIENCSSGGHRLEPSMMELVSMASFSDAHETTAIPLIAANVQRVIPPSQSQIWAVLREKDDESRLYYSLINTFFGRMCLSGDIDKLSEGQWRIVQDAISFYRQASDIIRDGSTSRIDTTTTTYNNPQGNQLLIRTLENRSLIIYHRFENSESVDLSQVCPEGSRIIAGFGKADRDFSAQAWIVET